HGERADVHPERGAGGRPHRQPQPALRRLPVRRRRAGGGRARPAPGAGRLSLTPISLPSVNCYISDRQIAEGSRIPIPPSPDGGGGSSGLSGSRREQNARMTVRQNTKGAQIKIAKARVTAAAKTGACKNWLPFKNSSQAGCRGGGFIGGVTG